LGDEITATWELNAQDVQKNEVHSSGSVKNLAFTPQTEMSYKIDVDGEKKEDRIRSGYSKKNNKLSLLGGQPAMYINIPLDIETGAYPIGKEDGQFDFSIPDPKYDTMYDEIYISINGEQHRTVNFEFQTK